ncbi:MAG: hypothetical protein V1921_01205 [Candidatus Altiarchaeota archaeon]
MLKQRSGGRRQEFPDIVEGGRLDPALVSEALEAIGDSGNPPIVSDSLRLVKRLPDSGLAVKYSMGEIREPGADMFGRHLRAHLLDKYFVLSGKYRREHVPEPAGFFDSELSGKPVSGYAYPFTEGKANFDTVFVDYVDGRRVDFHRTVDEWGEFQNLMKDAGFDFSSRNFDKGAWAGGVPYYEDIVYFGRQTEEKFSSEWAVFDFCKDHVRFSEPKFDEFLGKNEAALRERLGDRDFQRLKHPKNR